MTPRISRRSCRSRKTLTLVTATGEPLPIPTWSTGQREFIPLLLGLYQALPPQQKSKHETIETIIIEEPEMGLHPPAVAAVISLFLELLHRGYQVVLSTHSPVVLDAIWALTRIQAHSEAQPILDLFDLGPSMKKVALSCLSKKIRVYSFSSSATEVRDISRLDPFSLDPDEETWGGVAGFSQRANEIVAKVNSNI